MNLLAAAGNDAGFETFVQAVGADLAEGVCIAARELSAISHEGRRYKGDGGREGKGRKDSLSESSIHLSMQRHGRRRQLSPSKLQPWFRDPFVCYQTEPPRWSAGLPGGTKAQGSRKTGDVTDLPADIDHAGLEAAPFDHQSIARREEEGGFVGPCGHNECVCVSTESVSLPSSLGRDIELAMDIGDELGYRPWSRPRSLGMLAFSIMAIFRLG